MESSCLCRLHVYTYFMSRLSPSSSSYFELSAYSGWLCSSLSKGDVARAYSTVTNHVIIIIIIVPSFPFQLPQKPHPYTHTHIKYSLLFLYNGRAFPPKWEKKGFERTVRELVKSRPPPPPKKKTGMFVNLDAPRGQFFHEKIRKIDRWGPRWDTQTPI